MAYLVSLILQLVDRRQGTIGRLEINEAVALAAVGRLVKDGFCRAYGPKSKRKICTWLMQIDVLL